MVVERIRALKVICPDCNVPMRQQSDEAAVIQLSTRTKMVVHECPNCGAETERQITPLIAPAIGWPDGEHAAHP
jgi:hypothetical protein